ncbi:DUF445 domain-containing protein [Paenibacillus sp. IITD108]|uniref:DUF445 domain-containing protein n=1 Tax=Paenibacillus sp. IITD108 TaxID=3116649 RepID=UPI002F42F01C
MSKENIRKGANTALAVSGAGILAAFPFQNTFAGGLLFSACSAAVIGGLADSFAVSALFGEPLCIRWPSWMGTRIIAKNRDRLIKELVHMVEHELLTVDNIRLKLGELSFSSMARAYLEQGGEEELSRIAQKLVTEFVARADIKKLSADLEELLFNHADAISLSDLLADIAHWSIKHNYDSELIAFLAKQLQQAAHSSTFRTILEKLIHSAIKSYEGDKFRRRLLDYAAGLNSEFITDKVQQWLIQYLDKASKPVQYEHQLLRQQIQSLELRLRHDHDFRKKVEEGKLTAVKAIHQNKQLATLLEKLIISLQGQLTDSFITGETSVLYSKSRQWLAAWRSNESKQADFDQMIKQYVLRIIEQKHAIIGRTVEEGLNKFSEQQLIDLVKEKAGKDLQFIRLNGIVVGALIGCVIYLSTFWIGVK